jgi:hypothetical protein
MDAGDDGLTFILEHELSYAFILIVVPYHDFVGGVPGVPPAPHYGYQVASEEHLHYSDPCNAHRQTNKQPGRYTDILRSDSRFSKCKCEAKQDKTEQRQGSSTVHFDSNDSVHRWYCFTQRARETGGRQGSVDQ